MGLLVPSFTVKLPLSTGEKKRYSSKATIITVTSTAKMVNASWVLSERALFL